MRCQTPRVSLVSRVQEPVTAIPWVFLNRHYSYSICCTITCSYHRFYLTFTQKLPCCINTGNLCRLSLTGFLVICHVPLLSTAGQLQGKCAPGRAPNPALRVRLQDPFLVGPGGLAAAGLLHAVRPAGPPCRAEPGGAGAPPAPAQAGAHLLLPPSRRHRPLALSPHHCCDPAAWLPLKCCMPHSQCTSLVGRQRGYH